MDSIGVEEARRRLPELLTKPKAREQTIIKRHGRLFAALYLAHTGLMSVMPTGTRA